VGEALREVAAGAEAAAAEEVVEVVAAHRSP